MVHVGANYLPGPFNRHPLPPELIATEITSLLDEIGNLYQAIVSSVILPQKEMASIEFVNRINYLVCNHCFFSNIEILQCMHFQRRMGMLELSLLANDGTHLSRKGVEVMFNCFCEHIKFVHKWGNIS